MRPLHDWWREEPREVFWLEVTDRPDLGDNLKAPQCNEHDGDFWSYSLLKKVRPGDIVFHYYRSQHSILARSVATGELWEDYIIWAARGASARTAGIEPHKRAGWFVGLESFQPLAAPVTLTQLRELDGVIRREIRLLAEAVGNPLYFPLELGDRRPMRPMQGYLFKLPRFMVELLPALLNVLPENLADPQMPSACKFGTTYRPADELTAVGQRNPFAVDPALVERGLRSHATIQNQLAAFLRDQGLEPRSPCGEEPSFDLAWESEGCTWVAEIKSTTPANEEKQLRLGLGQVLRYCHLLRARGEVRPVLVLERRPADASWQQLCSGLGVRLLWPESWRSILCKDESASGEL